MNPMKTAFRRHSITEGRATNLGAGWLLASNMLAAYLAGEVGLGISEWCLARVAEDGLRPVLVADGHQDLTVSVIDVGSAIRPLTGDSKTINWYRFCAAPYVKGLINEEDIVGMELFDRWTHNAESRETIFVDTGNGLRAIFMENGGGFSSTQGRPRRNGFRCDAMRSLARRGDQRAWLDRCLAHWASRLSALDSSRLHGIMAGIPVDWRPDGWEEEAHRWIERSSVECAVAVFRCEVAANAPPSAVSHLHVGPNTGFR